MSYRNYLYAIDKKKLEELKAMSEDEIRNKYGEGEKYQDNDGKWWDDRFVWLPDLVDGYIFEYGSYSNFPEKIKPLTKPVFPEDWSLISEHDFAETDRRAIEVTLDIMRQGIYDQYKEWFEDPEKGKHTFRQRIAEWDDNRTIYNTDSDTDNICNSWHWEYLVFELARVLKTFDWEKKTLIFVGY